MNEKGQLQHLSLLGNQGLTVLAVAVGWYGLCFKSDLDSRALLSIGATLLALLGWNIGWAIHVKRYF